MMRAEPMNTHTTGIDTNHSTMSTLLLERNVICRAIIDLEPKIRTAGKNLILLPKTIRNVSVCTTYVSSYICLYISRNHLLQQYLILEFLLAIVTENVFSLASFLYHVNAKPGLLKWRTAVRIQTFGW